MHHLNRDNPVTLREAIDQLRPDIPARERLMNDLKSSPYFCIRDIYDMVAPLINPRGRPDIDRYTAQLDATIYKPGVTRRDTFGDLAPANTKTFRFKHCGDTIAITFNERDVHICNSQPPYKKLHTYPYEFYSGVRYDLLPHGPVQAVDVAKFYHNDSPLWEFQRLPCGLMIVYRYDGSACVYFVTNNTRGIPIQEISFNHIYDDYGELVTIREYLRCFVDLSSTYVQRYL